MSSKLRRGILTLMPFSTKSTNIVESSSGVQQGSVLGPILYKIPGKTCSATFADDTVIMQ